MFLWPESAPFDTGAVPHCTGSAFENNIRPRNETLWHAGGQQAEASSEQRICRQWRRQQCQVAA
jgi:hypothetical protein